MTQESQRADLDHKPENARKVGAEHHRLNKQGEQPRNSAASDPKKPQ